MASPVLTVNHEGFGRILLTAGRLVVLSKTLRDVHRFGFDNLQKLAEAGTGLVDNGLTTIKTYSDVARV
jgi:probable nitrogen fixation protein